MAHKYTSEIYGVSEQELYAEWRERGGDMPLAEWLAAQYRELGNANPDGGWDDAIMPDFDALARQIERVVEVALCPNQR